MKIEGYTLSMHAEHALSVTRSTTFETELQTLELEKEADRKKLLDGERQLVARLHYELLNRLLRVFGGYRRGNEPAEVSGEWQGQRRVEQMRIVERSFEKECVEVNMQGCVKSDTGEFAIDVNLSMSRSIYVETRISETRFFDPLVINFDGAIPELDTTTFRFDIDNDGTEEQISELKQGNGFLALDRNCNGFVDNGCELFGTETGHGFVELSMHDEDGNDWIDANDAIFDKLRIWLEESGEKRLVALGEMGIGAIYLGSAYSPYEYKTVENEALGKLRSTGLFLYENGSSGTIGEIDFAERDAVPDGLSQALASLA